MPLSKKALNRRIAIFVVVTVALLLPVTASGGLIVHYNFEEAAGNDAIDLADGDRPGTLINGATQAAGDVPPVNGGAQALDVSGSSNAAVDLGSGGLLQDVGGSTFAAWVKPDTFQNGERFIYRSGFNGGRSMLMAGIDGADQPNGLPPGTGIGFQRRVFDESGGKATLGTSALSTGVWQHVALSLNYQTGDWAWYIDGADAGSGVVGAWQSDPSNSTADDNGSNTLGDSSPGGNGGFSGLIDDFRLYDHALTAQEIADLLEDLPAPVVPVEFSWNLAGLGNWNSAANWTPAGGPANSASHTAILGSSITADSTITVDTPVTVNRIEFKNTTQTYAVSGLASVNLSATTDPDNPVSPTLSVQGNHQFQAVVNLGADATADIASDSTLTFNNTLALMGHTLTKTGEGTMAIRNDLTLGGGTVELAQGSIAGNGTIGGNVNNAGGTISPGNLAAVTLSEVPEPEAALLLVLGGVVAMMMGGSMVRFRQREKLRLSLVERRPIRPDEVSQGVAI